jgi:hypothetical protein
MDKLQEFLKGWLINYLKNRNIAFRNIEKIEEKGTDIFVKYKDKDAMFYIRPFLKDFAEFSQKKDNITVVVFNSKANLDALISGWEKIKQNKGLSVYFVNPFSETEIKWFIVPYTHDKICDAQSLKQGLKSMFDTVEPISEEQAERRVKDEKH